jgi:predicted phage terminase large subunit-like protein
MTTFQEQLQAAYEWPVDHKLRLLARAQRERWIATARDEQLPPEGEWRIWYMMAGRGAGKSRAAAETLSDWEGSFPPGEWAIIAPTFADGRDTCVEAPESGLLNILGARVAPGGWNRSLGEIHLRSGSKIYVDGADDGALRIQGKNLRGAWAEEVGLWVKWDQAWNESLAFAVRHEPGRIVVSGTPKMGHGLVRQLVEDKSVPVTRMRTSDNVGNLHPAAIRELYERYGGTRLGQQELEGEWISAIEGDALKRAWWRYYEPKLLKPVKGVIPIGNGEVNFQWVIISCDAPLKDKQASDNVAIQAWGVDKANRYLVDSKAEKMSYEQAKRAITEMSRWARQNWRRAQHRELIENAGMGPELIVDLQRELGGVQKITANAEGNKGQRALAAAGDLETGNVFLPGKIKSDLSGPDERACPAMTISLVEEAALFQVDGSHDSHDDQVDAWSQCMNWLRSRQTRPARTWSSFKNR